MCYSSSTSIKAFSIGVISSLLLVYLSSKKDYKIIGYFFLFVVLMQLYDAIFWNYPPINKSFSKTNEIATKFAIIFNHLQPIVLYLLIYYYNKGKIDKSSKWLTLFYTIVIIIYTLNLWNKVKYTKVTERSSPSLDWEWNHQFGAPFVYFIFLITLIVLFYQNVKIGGKLAAFLTLISFLFSLYKYQIKANTGRFWCFFSAYAPLLFLIYSVFN
jgi:hypothetical protein